MKESVTKFDLEAAFKELNSFEIPKAEKGIRANRNDLSEAFEGAKAKKLKIEALVEDYYNINSTEDLEQANADREAEIAKAKLARIEKIVDLEAESEEDLLPNYVGKIIVQCPQCMTLFYKDKADIVESEENPETVNVGELCQHCGNESGYTIIGKVGTVEDADTADDLESKIDLAAEEALEDEENTEEIESDEEPVEETEETTDEEDLNLDLVDIEEEPTEEQEEVKESLALNEDIEAESEEIEETPVEEILTSVAEVKEVAEEAAEAVLEASEEETLEDIKEITDEVVENHFEVSKENEAETGEKSSEEDEEIEENLTEARRRRAVDEDSKVYVIYLDSTDIGGYAGQLWLGDDLDEAKSIFKDEVEQAKKAGLDADSYRLGLYEIYLNAISSPLVEILAGECIDDLNSDLAINTVNKLKKAHCFTPVFEYLNESLKEAVDKELDAKLKAHNEYIEYLKDMLEKEEKSLANAKNDFVKKSIQSRIDALRADLEAALPEALKDEIETELPTAEEVELEATENVEEPKNELASVKDSLTEALDIEKQAEVEIEKSKERKEKYGDTLLHRVPKKWFENEKFKADFEDFWSLKASITLNDPNSNNVIYLFDDDHFEDICKAAKRYGIEESLNESEAVNISLTEDNLDLSDAEAEELFNSDEFKQPISDEELIQEFKNESVDSKKAIAISDLDIEELDDEAIEKAISEALNTDEFKLAECYVKNNSLIILGNVEKNNVKCFAFNEAFVEDNNVTLSGLTENYTIKLTGKISDTKNLITESFLIN